MNEQDLQPRVVVFPRTGRFRSASIDPTKYVAARLVSELADAWKAYAETASLSPGTVVRHACVTRKLGDYLTADADRFLTMSGDGAAVAKRLHDWESAMVAKFPPPSVHAKDLGVELRNQVHRYLQSNAITHGVLTDWANGNVLDGRPSQAIPLDEFSNGERLQLEQTCRQIVRETEERLAHGDSLLRQGRDPRKHGWDCVQNLLWALRNLPYEDEFRDHLVGKRRQVDPWEIDALSATRRVNGAGTRPPLLYAVGTLLVPDPEYQLAIRVLIHLQTGWSPEETLGLRRTDVEFSHDRVRVRATKARAQRIRWHVLNATSEAQPWGWKAGDLLRRAAHAMRHGHALTPNEQQFWMIGCRSARDRLDHEYPHYIIRPNQFNHTLGKLVEDHGLSISKPHDMRRLRKTVKSARAALLGTLAGAAGDDHSVEVFRGHYAQTTTVHTIAAQTVLRAQQKVLHRASQGPALVTAAAAEIAQNPTPSEFTEIAASVAAETPTEQELTIAACRDPLDAPFQEKGVLCHASPSMCLQCRNAIVFRDHLPRLIAYKEALNSIENNMAPVVFSEIYGQQRVNIDAILAEFPPEHIDAARRAPVHVHRPLGQRAQQ
ncbi:hypothetical protein OLG66_29195 [Mycobacterium senegalense]|uniref:hypothetical protein n=1 Tax=Mycolicibacterium senegalense TaxID=1796 RepID=UPI00222342C7|nr:hypothetical protein [Mycolicibacterium senegalense]MCW1824998.1 hypothetical protein [Mycolicibacterium senegalense]